MADLVFMQVQAVIDERTSVVCLHAAGMVEPVGPGVYESLAADMAPGLNRTSSVEEWVGVDLPKPEGNMAMHGVQDDTLREMVRITGYDGLPRQVTREEYEQMLAEGGTRVLRGVKPTDTMTAEEMAEAFQRGDMFVGRGVYGNGVYFEASDSIDLALQYAGEDGAVLDYLIAPDARLVNYSDLQREMVAWHDAFRKLTPRQNELNEAIYAAQQAGDKTTADRLLEEWRQIGAEKDALTEIMTEPGRFATAMGYDVIVVDHIPDRLTYRVVLNRTALVYPED